MSGQLSIFRFSISGRSWSVWTASAFISASSRKHGKADRQHKHKTIFREGIFMRLQDNAAFAPLRCVLAGFFKIIMLNSHALIQISVCLGLSAVLAAAGMAVLKRKTL